MSASQSASSRGSGFEAYIATLAARTPQLSPRQLHPDFDTWQAFFDHVNSTGPLKITLPATTKTNLELMRLLDALRKENLDMVNVGDQPGHVAICTRAQAVALRAKAAPKLGMVRNYLTKSNPVTSTLPFWRCAKPLLSNLRSWVLASRARARLSTALC